MIALTRRTARMSVVTWASVVFGLAGLALAQTTQPAGGPTLPGQQQGRIKGDNVYIRSGSHQNYYPVTKLNRNDPVTVVGEQYGWLEILPPSGTFSLIEKTYVDRTGDTGKLSEEHWINAGSNLDNRRYAKQVKLKRGDSVRILGETADGAFLKIEPPEGAHLWVKADFVEGVTIKGTSPAVSPPVAVKPGELNLDNDSPSAATTTRPAAATKDTKVAPRAMARSNDKPGPAKASEKFQSQIEAIEAELAAIKDKPDAEQAYERVISKLTPMATQKEDEIASLYATARIDHIRGYIESQAGLKRISQMREDAIRNADKVAAERVNIRVRPTNPTDEIVVRGEIRVSTVYEGAAGRAKRWRVVEPSTGSGSRTLAYIELPADSAINPVDYYGKYIGIRASGRQTLSGSNPPIPIYTVAEIVVLDRDSDSGRVGGSSAYASPNGPAVRLPASQPAATQPSGDAGALSGDSQ